MLLHKSGADGYGNTQDDEMQISYLSFEATLAACSV